MRLEELAVRVIEAAEAEEVETLDMEYIERWCAMHGTLDRLKTALDGIPPLD